MMSPKPNFKAMSLQELKKYVLSHRDDQEAWQEFTHRDRPNAVYFDTDVPLETQKQRLQELIEKEKYSNEI
ncbi:hypothetical protein [Cyanothece sp. BG0011]|uniref:DUF6887 family protein n=1 Tax=Cyanothece sp. BG0011 TaxID=2082950 RepID=UPI0018E52C2C|nr:hypothetical protein [Cyanothece sp. BG0011]